MKRTSTLIVLLLLVFQFIFTSEVKAQNFKEAGPYMSYITDQNRNIMNNYMSYTSAVAHGKSAKTVDGLRQTLMQTVKTSLANVKTMPGFEGDFSLRDSAIVFLNI